VLVATPRNAPALVERGKVALAQRRPARAREFLWKAAEVTPYDRDTAYTFAQCLDQLDEEDEARKWLGRVDQIDADQKRLTQLTRRMLDEPRNPALRSEAGEIFLRNGQEHQGLRWLYSALQEDPRHRPAHRALARYYQRNGQADLAAQHERALQAGGTP